MDLEFFVRFCFQETETVFDDESITKVIDSINSKQISTAVCIRDKYGDKIKALKEKRVLFVGDSLTKDRAGYRGIVLKAGEMNSKNMAFSGATSTDMYRFIYENICLFKPEIISVLIGTNDAFMHCGMKKEHLVSTGEYRRNIKGILENCTNSGARVIVSTIPPMDENAFNKTNDALFKANNNENIAVYNKIIRETVIQTDAELIDLEAALSQTKKDGLYEPDGVHLSFRGQSILAGLWIEKALSAN